MKQKISLALALILLFAGTSCSNEGNNSGTPSKSTETPTAKTTIATEATPKVDPEAQKFAEKLFTKCSHSFVNPLSIKLTNAWYYHYEYHLADLEDDHYFTFEFTVENSAGVEQHVYYGNSISFKDLSDEEISTAGKDLAFGYTSYFGENNIRAMQEGEPLDAAAIQQYFLKNY